ncbi:hypothetical protein [Halosimplex pelagicum]|uniref:DUF8069 domain-containing protein n=1 Tax=Halosimplex pelagicum TaxID=869886 RepID=A0A7D5P5I8_9EURY|nr:hypothetical protein [Halosimplex pelagicum]QLH81323.1 hypothetical protein HZS54_06645 [Halosimplex pelagicum]
MAGPDPFDDTSVDHEQLETELLAQDHDVESVATADIDDATARRLVDELVDADIVTLVPENCVFVHDPSGTAFDSHLQLAVFHRGWTAARDTDAEAK